MGNLVIGLEIVTNTLTSVEEAISLILKDILLQPSHEEPLINLFGRTLSKPIVSKINNPPDNVSSMDGYAIKNSDIENKIVKFSIIGKSLAGKKCNKKIKSGEAVRIFTGAILPDGADRIILQEDIKLFSDKDILVDIGKIEKNNFFIRNKGTDFRTNEILVEEGEILNARKLSLSIASGNSWATVRSKPRIGIISTGDELLKFGELSNQNSKDKIISSNGVFLYNFINELGGEAFYLPTAEDNINSLNNIFQQIKNYDLIISTGGASVGDYDLVQSALSKSNFKLSFWKIAMRPGKPVFFGSLKGIPFLGLPGNPVSTGVCAIVFLKKIIQKFLGQKLTDDIVFMRLNKDLEKNDRRKDYLRSKISNHINDEYSVEPFSKQDSGQISIFSKSDGFIIREPYQEKLKKGTKVPVLRPPYKI